MTTDWWCLSFVVKFCMVAR